MRRQLKAPGELFSFFLASPAQFLPQLTGRFELLSFFSRCSRFRVMQVRAAHIQTASTVENASKSLTLLFKRVHSIHFTFGRQFDCHLGLHGMTAGRDD